MSCGGRKLLLIPKMLRACAPHASCQHVTCKMMLVQPSRWLAGCLRSSRPREDAAFAVHLDALRDQEKCFHVHLEAPESLSGLGAPLAMFHSLGVLARCCGSAAVLHARSSTYCCLAPEYMEKRSCGTGVRSPGAGLLAVKERRLAAFSAQSAF